MSFFTRSPRLRCGGVLALIGSALGVALGAWPAEARVLDVDLERRVVILDGRAFGARGAYELLEGSVAFGFDPANAANTRVSDIALGPRGADGLVHARASLTVLQAVDPSKRRGTAVVEVVNRGRRLALGSLNRAALSFSADASLDPARPSDFGDGLAMEEGISLISVGWQYDVPDFPGAMRFDAPRARNADGTAVRGLARSDWVVDEAAERLPLAAMGHVPNPAAEPAAPENRLTVREGREAERRLVPRENWHFDETGTHILLEGGFAPGSIYELVYVAHDPPLAGLGFAAFRDIISYMRFDENCDFPAERGIALGSSQAGRFLRHFLHEGFNRDEAGRQAYQGVVMHIAGAGRGGFNHRFAHPGRVGNPFRNFFYPGDDFPFASRPTRATSAETEVPRGVFDRALASGTFPRLFQINTGYEYWGRGAALIHTTPDGRRDLEPLENERLYHLASAPHYPLPFPPAAQSEIAPGVFRGSPLETSAIMRSLVLHMLAWVEIGTPPPPTRVPRIDDATLVGPSEVRNPVPRLHAPKRPHVAYPLDFGPAFAAQGIVDKQPPERGPAYATLVPQVDPQGIEVGGVRTLALRVPIGSYLPWALRTGYPFAEDEMADFLGTFAPFARGESERVAAGDERPSLAELYPTRAVYDARIDAAITELIAEGWMLSRDREHGKQAANARWEWAQARAPAEASARPDPPVASGHAR